MRIMMRSLAAIALASFTGGCVTTGGTVITPPSIAQIQGAAVAACSFLPTADTVAGLISSDPTLKTAEAIAALICAVVVPKQGMAAPRQDRPVINGVFVRGQFVN